MNKKLKTIIIIASLGFLMVACKSSIGDVDPPPLTSGKLFYHSGSISMLDSGNPSASPIIIETGNTREARTFLDGRVDVINRQITDLHLRTVIYGNKDDGRFYKISALADDSTTPVQVSNETNAAAMCDAHLAKTEPDWSDHSKSVYLYKMPGADANCSTADDLFKMVRLNMTASDEPLLAKEVLGPIRDERGAIIGFLAIDGNEVVRYNWDFQNRKKIISFLSHAEELESFFSEGNKFLWIDEKVYHYNETTRELSSQLHTFSDGIPSRVLSVSDETTMYFTDGNHIFEIPLDGSVPASLFASEVPNPLQRSSTLQRIRLTNNSLIYDALTDKIPLTRVVNAIKAVEKTTRTTTILVHPTHDTVESVLVSFIAGDFVYYNRFGPNGLERFPPRNVIRGRVKNDGTEEIEIKNATWLGATTLAISSQGPIFGRLVWVEGCRVEFSCSGGTIKSFDAATHGDELVIGTIPSDIHTISRFSGFKGGILVAGRAIGSLDEDIFYLNPNQAGSLKRITTTPDFAESRIF